MGRDASLVTNKIPIGESKPENKYRIQVYTFDMLPECSALVPGLPCGDRGEIGRRKDHGGGKRMGGC